MEAQRRTLFFNANVLTMDREYPYAEAFLVDTGRVAALGTTELLKSQITETTQVDLEGQTVIPGFNDCHCHILSFGLTLDQLDVSADAVSRMDDILRLVAARAQETAEGGWVVGRGYDQNVLAERRDPSRSDLDAVSPDKAAVLWHTSGHGLTCNSIALERAGISSATETPAGGVIVRDEHGEPTGVLKETPAMDLVAQAMPSPSLEEGRDAILQAMRVMASHGITSASDAATGQRGSIEDALAMYRAALDSGGLSGRVTLMPQVEFVAPPHTQEIHTREEFEVGNDPEWLSVGAVKIFSDGALTTRTAALRAPFNDDDSRGVLIWQRDELRDMVGRSHRAGWQIATHAIGDLAIDEVLAAYELALDSNPRPDHRHRIEHCMLLDRDLVERMSRSGVVAVLQPAFIGRLGDAYVDGLGMARASQLMPMQLFDVYDVPVAYSSDRPVIPGAPMRGIRSAVERVTPRGVALGTEHTVSVLEALRHYTAGSALATREERQKGTLRRGAFADFTVLSRNPAQIGTDEWDSTRVTMTVCNGRQTFGE